MFVVVGDVVLLHGGFAKVRDTHKRVQGKTFTVGPHFELSLASPKRSQAGYSLLLPLCPSLSPLATTFMARVVRLG